MKNPHPMMTKDGVSDADLIRAARDMYDLIEQIYREAGVVGNEALFSATSAVLAKVRGES